jgi:hypothetical protein
MMCTVADMNPSDNGQHDGGVLANLPRTRPQRSSARRAAARGASTAPSRPRKTQSKRAPAKARSGTAAASTAPAAPSTADTAATPAKPKSRVRATRPAAATKRSTTPRRPPSRKGPSSKADEPAPRQGFESEGETSGRSVQPPGGPEFVATAAEIVNELAKAGLSTGERLFKDVLSRLPLS